VWKRLGHPGPDENGLLNWKQASKADLCTCARIGAVPKGLGGVLFQWDRGNCLGCFAIS
jgi:hypothetical protein